MGVCTLLEFDAPNWAGRLGVGAWFAAAPRAAILACNSAISCYDPVSRSLLMYWMASLFSPKNVHLGELCVERVGPNQYHDFEFGKASH